jgi:hypothetical protein
LRLLRHALWDFEKVARCLTDVHWENDVALGVILRNILALSFEVRAGHLSQEQLARVSADASIRLFKKEHDETPADQLKLSYPEVEFDQKIITPKWIAALFFDGLVDADLTRKMLDSSSYYATPDSIPAWKIAWNGWEIPDEQYEKAVARVEEQFQARGFTVLGELLHVFGLRLLFSTVGAINKTKASIVSECKSYIDDLKKAGRLPDPLTYRQDHITMGWEGLGFFERDTQEFKGIVEYLDASVAAARDEILPARGLELLEIMKTDVQELFRQLCINNVSESPYFDIPVLARIDPNLFVDRVLKLTPLSQSSVFSSLKEGMRAGCSTES